MDVFDNNGTPKSSFLIRFFIINHPFWGTPILGNTHIVFRETRKRPATPKFPKRHPKTFIPLP